MAEHAHSTTASTVRPPIQTTAREDFDQALTQSRIIVDILEHLAGALTSYDAPVPGQSLYSWLIKELEDRLERVEVADMAMSSARA